MSASNSATHFTACFILIYLGHAYPNIYRSCGAIGEFDLYPSLLPYFGNS